MSSPVWLVGISMISCPVRASGTEPSDLYRSFFPWPQAVSSHTCVDQYCAEYLKETFHVPGFSLCPSLITGSLSHELQLPCFPWTFGFTSTVQGVGLRPPLISTLETPWKQQSWANSGAHLVCFSSLRVAVLFCLVSSAGETSLSCVFLFLSFEGRGKSESSGRRVNLISVIPFLPEAAGISLYVLSLTSLEAVPILFLCIAFTSTMNFLHTYLIL